MFLCQPVIWSMAAILRDSTVVIVVAATVVRTRPRAIPLAMITMGFLLFPIYGLLMGLRLATLLGDPSGRRSSAIIELFFCKKNTS